MVFGETRADHNPITVGDRQVLDGSTWRLFGADFKFEQQQQGGQFGPTFRHDEVAFSAETKDRILRSRKGCMSQDLNDTINAISQ